MSSGDGGNYTCSPQNIVSDTVLVTIMEGDGNFAAVYTDTVTSSTPTTSATVINIVIIMVIIVYC